MRKYIIVICALVMLIMAGCKTERRLLNAILTVNQENVYEVNQTGTYFDETKTITRSDILEQLDIPEDYQNLEVNIEGVEAKIVLKSGNVADSVDVSGWVNGYILFSNVHIDFASFQDQWAVIYPLNSGGVGQLIGVINDIISNTDYVQSFTVRLSGNFDPSGKIFMDITLRIKCTVNFDRCVEVPTIFTFGDKCEE